MKNSILLLQSRLMYESTRHKIQISQYQSPDDTKWIEWAFCLSMQTWLSIEKMANDYQFINKQEEVCFYKSHKPRFTGLIDYFTLLYKSILFQPEDDTKWEAYWGNELNTCIEVISKLKTAYLNYRHRQSDTDIYFLKHNNQQPLVFGGSVTVFEFNSTSYTCLLGRLIALKKYKKQIQDKIYEFPLRQAG
jgi:hypothetical protein